MKLYTEEQVKDAFIRGILKGMAGSTISTYELFEMYISELTPIELPSDEEIEETFTFYPQMIEGAKWMKKQILNQNNRVSTQDPAIDIITNPEGANDKETNTKISDIDFMYKWIRSKSGK